MGSLTLIRVTDFHKTYRQTVAVRGLTFEVPPGQILGLVGPNGARKTTIMWVLGSGPGQVYRTITYAYRLESSARSGAFSGLYWRPPGLH